MILAGTEKSGVACVDARHHDFVFDHAMLIESSELDGIVLEVACHVYDLCLRGQVPVIFRVFPCLQRMLVCAKRDGPTQVQVHPRPDRKIKPKARVWRVEKGMNDFYFLV
jgi:hypothetical protein